MEKYLLQNESDTGLVVDHNNEVDDALYQNKGSTNAKRIKLNNNSNRNNDYDQTQRKRKYLITWEENWPWLYHDEENNMMLCKYCKRFPSLAKPGGKSNAFFDGCTKFRVENMKSHQLSESHRVCASYYRCAIANPPTSTERNTTTNRALQMLTEKQEIKMSALFNIAYKIAKHGEPFSSYELDCELAKKLGVDIGDNYLNRSRCTEFIESISESMKEELIIDIQQSKFVTILADGSTDISTQEQENILIRYVSRNSNYTPITVLADIINLEHGHAVGVLDGIWKALKSVGLDKENLKPENKNPGPVLIGVNFDGASVMQGRKNGVAGLLLKDFPHIIPVWCIAHKLQLAIMDAVKAVEHVSTLETTVKGIYKYYHGSPKRRREIKAIAEVIDEDLANIPDVKEVRWVASQGRALMALKSNLNIVCIHLDEASTRNDVNAGVARHYLSQLKHPHVLKVMFLLLDILQILATLSKVEELALVSMLRREAEEKDSEGSSENETQHVEVVKNKQEDLDLAVQDPFSLAFQDEEEEDEEEDEPEHEMDDLNSFLNELTAKHTKS